MDKLITIWVSYAGASILSPSLHLLLSLVFWTRTACSAVWDTNAKSAS